MNNGRQRQLDPSGQPVDGFFTSGVGTNQTNANTLDSKNNLDLNSNGAANWGETPERDQKKIGGNVVSSLEQLTPSTETEKTELGKIEELEKRPGHQETNNDPVGELATTMDAMPADIKAELAAFRADNDHISREALDATKKMIREFNEGKITPAELDEARSKASQAYLKQSYGRVVGEAA